MGPLLIPRCLTGADEKGKDLCELHNPIIEAEVTRGAESC